MRADVTRTGHDRRAGRLTVAAVGLAQVCAIALGLGAPIQPLLSIAFVLTVPGVRLMDLTTPSDVSARLVLAVGASLSVNTSLATLALVSDSLVLVAVLAVVVWVLAVVPDAWLRSLRRLTHRGARRNQSD